ncbi:LOW QUALITY PROTEIN: PAX-interacting protein 1-like [Liolophura sinensis]|uniref:LOW QUALITY PROTEIN: PAX-interacting protein 1-like n=1 Tax=Liolophura sinensis TaxID=3198878 RepID=UPI0031584575
MTADDSEEAEKTVAKDLFKDVKYYLVGNISEEVTTLLNSGGAKQDNYLSQMVSHVICDSTEDDDDFSEAAEAKELFDLPVVSSQWVLLSVACRKQLPIETFAPEGKVFAGVVLCPEHLEEGDRTNIWAMVTLNGGVCKTTLNKATTHLVTTKDEGRKYEASILREESIKIVTPDWVTESLKAGTKVEEAVYHPKLIQIQSRPVPKASVPGTCCVCPSTTPYSALCSIHLPFTAWNYRTPTTEPNSSDEPHTSHKSHAPVKQKLSRGRPTPALPSYSIGFPGLPIPGCVPDNGRVELPTAKEALARMVNNRIQAIPPDMCLLGCVFLIADNQTLVGADEINTWKKVIEQHGGQVEVGYSQKITHVLCPYQHTDVFQQALKDQRRIVTAYWLNDCLLQKKMVPPWQALHLPLIYGDQKPCEKQIICVTNFEGEERTRVKHMITSIGAKYTGYMSHANSALVCKKMEGKKYEKARDWQTPVVNVNWLTDILLGNLDALRLPVHQKYQQFGQGNEFNMNLNVVAHLMVGWETPLVISKDVWKRFVPGTLKAGNDENKLKRKADDAVDSDAKKQKLEEEIHPSGFPTYGPRVMFTGYGGKVLTHLKEVVERLGGIVVDDIKDGTHLVARSLTRTLKLFVGINVCRCIVTKEWLEDSDQEAKFVDESKYALKDRQAEATMNCDLAESMRRSRKLPLFKGLSFYLTPSVLPSRKELSTIIESAKGTVLKKKPPLKTLQSVRSDKISHPGYSSYVIISCDTDIHLCRDLKAKKIAVHNAEFVLTGVLRQEVDFEIYRMPGFVFESKKSKADS